MQNIRTWFVLTVTALSLGLGGQVARAADEDQNGPAEKIYQNTARSFVIVSYHLQKCDKPYLNEADGAEAGGTVLQRILNQNAMDVVGVILNDQGEVFTFDREPTHREAIERITVQGPDGTVLPAKADRLLTRTSGQILRIEGKMPAAWQPLQFVEQAEVTAETDLFLATMGIGKYYRIYVRPCDYGFNWDSTMNCGHCLRMPGVYSAGVLCNAEGKPVGVTCLDEIDLGPSGPTWRGKDLLADPGIPAEQQKQLEEKLAQQFARNLYEIRIMPRPEPQEEEEVDFGRRFRGRYSGQPAVQEVLVYGLGVAESKLLIPDALPKDMVAGIDTITVKVGNEDIPARFGGVLKDCTATVIELEKGKLPQFAAFPAEGKITRLEPFWAVSASELAGMDVRAECSRWVDKQQGYADKWYMTPERALPAGSWLVNREGNLIGFLGQARHECDRLEPYLLGREQGRFRPYRAMSAMYSMMRGRPSARAGARYGYPGDSRLFEAAEMAQMLGELPKSCDPYIRHLDKDEQKRRVWLGVEYTAPDKEIIKQMNLREQTQDGRIGVVVNRVYAGSPAATMGLTEGDILLKVTVPGAPWPIELAGDDRESYSVPEFDEVDVPRELGQMPRARPWPSQDNYVNRLLADIGTGTTVKLSYLHGDKMLEKEFTIQQAPRDMLSAARYKNEKLGLTVKDATYEVRAALRLNAEEPVIVAVKVEQGTPAALARINTYELIRAVDGVSVDCVATFEKLLAQAQEAKKDSVRLTVEWMGKTRLADLKFEAKPPAGLPNILRRGGRPEP